MLESNVWGESSFLFIHTTWIGNDLLKIRKMNSAELILKTAYSSAIALAAILKTRSARRLARCLLPAFLCAHIFIKRETSGYEEGFRFCFPWCCGIVTTIENQSLKQRKKAFEPGKKLHHNIYLRPFNRTLKAAIIVDNQPLFFFMKMTK